MAFSLSLSLSLSLSPPVVSVSIFPSPFTMGSPRSDGGLGDIYSHAPRSRTNSGVSTTEGLFRSLELVDSPPTSYASSSTSIPSSSHLALDSFARSHLTLPAEGNLDADWFDTPQTAAQGTPLLRVDPAESYSRLTPSSSPTSNPQSSTMRFVVSEPDPSFEHITTFPNGLTNTLI